MIFALLFVFVREWAVRTAENPWDDKFELLLNRVYPYGTQTLAGALLPARVVNMGVVEVERLAERPAL